MKRLQICGFKLVYVAQLWSLNPGWKKLTSSKIDDLNQPFTFQTNEFDFIQSRDVIAGIKKNRWPSYITDCVR